ncbi:MAG: diadenylate cyclase, partial [Flavobacteriales bacterium]
MSDQLPLLFIEFNWRKAAEIVIIAVLLYQLYKIVKGTVAIKIFFGILAIYLFWKLVEALQMELLTEILGQFIGVGVIALIIVFQQELRRFLLVIGTTGFRSGLSRRFLRWKGVKEPPAGLEAVVRACMSMSENKTGALIVLARSSEPALFTTGGEEVDSLISSRLLESIFNKNSPLHDGAVIIEGNRIQKARCVLPVSQKDDFPPQYGMRHRSAMGIT